VRNAKITKTLLLERGIPAVEQGPKRLEEEGTDDAAAEGMN